MTIITMHRWAGSSEVTDVVPQNLPQMGAYRDGPVFILCARPDRAFGVFGPIEVTQQRCRRRAPGIVGARRSDALAFTPPTA